MQVKLHRWAAADHGRRFDDVYNFVSDPATLVVALQRVAGNAGARTAGVDGVTAVHVSMAGPEVFLTHVRSLLKTGTFRPLPVREKMIPKTGGKLRRLGIPTITDRVVQAALKLVLEPIFEADFQPCSYGFRPNRRAHDAIAEIQHLATAGYRWVLDADIEACFDRIDHPALMGRVRARVKDKRVLTLVKAFLKAGIMTELGERNEITSGTPQGGILSPLLANIALSVLDEFFVEQWAAAGTGQQRRQRRAKGLATWQLVRYADDFLGFRIVWQRKRGTSKWHVYTFIADKPVQALKRKIKSLTRRLSHLSYRETLVRINYIQRGWANYFKHAVAKHTFSHLQNFIWWRVINWVMRRNRMTWRAIQRWLRTPQGWQPIAFDGVELFKIAKAPVTRYRYRGTKIPNPWQPTPTSPPQRHDLVESPVR
ncbi:group II intron reverse transcriptase/maturase [Micromonospora qiuiae]|uniref:Group II intron reverse transcriptase/maturase n=1 Tax=Micromonospora qiuiae TaxID=502268 RepID=A0ABQ4JJP6_9ACTN|nr:group II intron reverse transcriptase/maturase [Micromonospora qiuiae]GIJ30823.1 group II intron reverse transcriptase/maturase [Micromonospora qiuiae]